MLDFTDIILSHHADIKVSGIDFNLGSGAKRDRERKQADGNENEY
jgi:hypothetical protein